LHTGRRNARRDIRSITHRIAIPMQARTQWTHSNILSQLATTREWSFKIGDWPNAKRQWNSERRAIYNATRCIDSRCGVIRHRGVSDGSDGARPLWRSHSTRTEYFFADGMREKENSMPTAKARSQSQVPVPSTPPQHGGRWGWSR